jgi:hypothetical protein
LRFLRNPFHFTRPPRGRFTLALRGFPQLAAFPACPGMQALAPGGILRRKAARAGVSRRTACEKPAAFIVRRLELADNPPRGGKGGWRWRVSRDLAGW